MKIIVRHRRMDTFLIIIQRMSSHFSKDIFLRIIIKILKIWSSHKRCRRWSMRLLFQEKIVIQSINWFLKIFIKNNLKEDAREFEARNTKFIKAKKWSPMRPTHSDLFWKNKKKERKREKWPLHTIDQWTKPKHYQVFF